MSISYYGGGEKWIIAISKELVKRGHEVEIHCLPFLLDGKPKINPQRILGDIPYHESLYHTVKADLCYITYTPLSWLNFKTSRPRIGGMHAHVYWQPIHPNYGFLPNLANLVNKFTNYFESRYFEAIHIVTDIYYVSHPRVYFIPYFVDSDLYRPHDKLNKFQVAFTSRRVWQKGYDKLLKIKEKVEPRIKVIVADGTLLDDEISKMVGESHLTIVPTRIDLVGRSIIESLMCETPVITTPLKAHKALNLPLVFADFVSEYVDKIQKFKYLWDENNEDYWGLAKCCRCETVEKYSKARVIDKMEKMFHEVVGK